MGPRRSSQPANGCWVDQLNVVAGLNRPGIGQQPLFGQQQAVADAQFGARLPGVQAAPIADVDDGILWRTQGLAVEQVRNRGDGVDLERLVRVELELHSYSSTQRP